jgi:proline dehydrogenase
MNTHRSALNRIIGELDRDIAAILLSEALEKMRQSNDKERTPEQILANKLERQAIRADAEKRLECYFMHVERILNGR